ncbi:ABC transporter permease [Roseateles sp. SL47]|uniref:ABC transporter permease n=1 Tax=Roseateles sp. SL47 TaxID=2995138 RepID=UPI0022716EA0|nr:ABC transporter permease [Roseateles sp. SL47]WAC71563.1 ABC transporter permease [Roseateles sp. SL47]
MTDVTDTWTLAAVGLLVALLRTTTPVLLAALGALVSDLAGCVNVALEGLMLVAAFFGVMGAIQAGHLWPGLPVWGQALIGGCAGLLAAMALSLLLAIFHLEFGADLIVAGIALNLLAVGLTVFLMASWVGDKGSTASLVSPALPRLQVPGLGGWPALNLLLNGEGGHGHPLPLPLALLAVPGVGLLLYRTPWGRWLRATGENPAAALGAGIPVKRMQYLALLTSGALAGLGGLYLSMGYVTLFQADMSAGRGFLALAAVFLGARALWGTAAASLLFGGSAVLVTQLGVLAWPPQVPQMLPPLMTLIAMLIAGHRTRNRALKTRAARAD